MQEVQARFEQLRQQLQRETDETRQRLNRSADERAAGEKAKFIASLLPALDDLTEQPHPENAPREAILEGIRSIDELQAALTMRASNRSILLAKSLIPSCMKPSTLKKPIARWTESN